MNVAYFLTFCEVTMTNYFLLTLIEISWLKYFYKYVWKSVRPLDEGFVVSCSCYSDSQPGSLDLNSLVSWLDYLAVDYRSQQDHFVYS